jgi:hypothetical protein
MEFMVIYHRLLEKSGRPLETSVGTDIFSADIRTEYLPNARQMIYLLDIFIVDERNVLYCREMNAVLKRNMPLY